ncbi:MAG: hypothetical protein WDM92_05245 [Caulobacteraceae bacterium]
MRNGFGYLWTLFASRNMEEMTGEAFARVQTFSSDWFADNFAGSTVRKVTRAMWGYDTISDVVMMGLGPAILVLSGCPSSCSCAGRCGPVHRCGGVRLCGAEPIADQPLCAAGQPALQRPGLADRRLAGRRRLLQRTIKAFGAEAREEQRFAGVLARWRKAVTITWFRGTHVWFLMNLIQIVLQAGLTGLLVRLWARGQASAATWPSRSRPSC